MRPRWTFLTGSAALLLFAALPLQAQGALGTVTGRVTSSRTGAPISDARVIIVGSTIGVATSEDGRYTLKNVRPGTFDLQFLRVGYVSRKHKVTITGGETTNVDQALEDATIQLQEITVTATGQQRNRELGNTVTNYGNVSKMVEQGPINSLSDAMQSKAPGVVVLPPTTLGGPPTLRVRGISSLSLSNSPIVYVDGVRYATNTLTSGTDTPFSLFNMLNPEEIDDIEVVKGPSAATLYGTNAANGVILITTKKGRAGAAKWTWGIEEGSVRDRTPYPDMYANFGHLPSAPTVPVRCQLATQATTGCITDSLTHYNWLRDGQNTFIKPGARRLYEGSVSGGTEAIRYFASGTMEDETGIISMPSYEISRFDAAKVTVRDEWKRPLSQARQSFRANFNAALSPKMDLSIFSGYSQLYNRQPPGDDLIIALLYVGIQNYGYKGCPGGVAPCGLDKIPTDAIGTPLHDAFTFAPGDIMQNLNESRVQRITNSSQLSWRPLSWLQNEASMGIDLAASTYTQICKLNECPPANATARQGRITDNKRNLRNISGKVSSNATFDYKPWLNFKTSVGGDYTWVGEDFVNANGVTLPPGATTVAAATTRTVSEQQTRATKTLGVYVQEQAGFNDRGFVTVAVRTDQNSAFGTKFQSVVYPKVSVSWMLSEEPWLVDHAPLVWKYLNSFRYRFAYGASGVQPGATDGLSIYSASAVSIATRNNTTSTDTPALLESQPANAELKPEKSEEIETGFETQFWNNRMNLDYTFYRKTTHDALININLAGSTGAAQLNPLQNIGSTQNWGHEVSLNMKLLDLRDIGWDMTFVGSHNSNKVLDLGIDKTTNKERILITNSGSTSGQVRNLKGMPINAQFYRQYTYNDANKDGILQLSELQMDSAFSFVGYRIPRDLMSISTGVDILNNTLRIQTLFDHKGGAGALDGANNFQCTTNPFACRESQDKTAPLWEQARNIAKFYGSAVGTAGTFKTARGYFMSNAFWKWREFSAAYQIPKVALSKIRAAEGSTVVFSVRNLHTWTNWTGVDPEANYGLTQTDFQNEFQTLGAPTYYTARLNLKF